jgi:hypothetical protein
MPRKKKINPNRFKPQKSNRREAVRPERRFYLIVCEGKETEPNYFEALKQAIAFDAPARINIEIFGEGYNTKSLIAKAIERKNEIEKDRTKKVDKIWVVFDKDSFGAEQFNAAIQACNRKDIEIEAAWSNEAFELWYLLHFELHQSALKRDQYKSKIEKHLRTAGYPDFKYEKNRKDMLALLGENRMHIAIRNAKKLAQHHAGERDHANHNPCTRVHELVIELLGLES